MRLRLDPVGPGLPPGLGRVPGERNAPERARLLTRGFEEGGIGGGTIYTGLALLGYADELMTEEAKGLVAETWRRAATHERHVRAGDERYGVSWYDELRRGWAPLCGGANAPVVRRSMELLGRDVIPYEENSGNVYAVGALGEYVILGAFGALVLFPPTRYLLKKYVLPTPGQGPSREARDAGKFASEVYAAGPAVAVAPSRAATRAPAAQGGRAHVDGGRADARARPRKRAAGGVSTRRRRWGARAGCRRDAASSKRRRIHYWACRLHHHHPSSFILKPRRRNFDDRPPPAPGSRPRPG